MAAERPTVSIVQQFATVSTTPAIPDLNTLIMGPSYHFEDYTAANKINILMGTYGDADATPSGTGAPTGVPPAGTPALTQTEPPNNVVGALLEASSVVIRLDKVFVGMEEGVDGAVTDNSTTFASAGAAWETEGVLAGDRVVITDGTTTIAKVVSSVTDDVELEFTSNFTVAGTDIDGNSYSSMGTSTLRYYIDRSLADGQTVATADVTITAQKVEVDGGLTFNVNNKAGTAVARTLHSATAYEQYQSLRQDLAVVTDLDNTGVITSALGTIDERNPLAVGAFLALQNTTTPVKVYGILKDNLNGGSDRAAGYTDALAVIESRTDIYCLIPLANETSILTSFKTHVVAVSDPDKSNFRIVIGSSTLPTTKTVSPSSTGLSEEDVADTIDVFVDPTGTFIARGVAVNDTLDIYKADGFTVDLTGTFTVAQILSKRAVQVTPALAEITSTDPHHYVVGQRTTPVTYLAGELIFADANPDTVTRSSGDWIAEGIKVGDKIGFAAIDAVPITNEGEYTVDTVTALEITIIATESFAVETTTVDAKGYAGSKAAVMNASATSRYVLRVLLDNTATFITDGVIATDLVDLSGTTRVIATVISENRVKITGTAGELTALADGTAGTTDTYSVIRALSKAGQVTELSAVTASLKDPRVTMVWPDLVDLVSVTNTLTGVATSQSGFYAAAAVGGMVAGLPSHQNFTRLSIAGISQLNNSNVYFSVDQIDALSSAGWYVLIQTTSTAAPFSVHALTTDTSTLESGELMVVKNFDFVSLFFKAIMADFLHGFNVLPETLDQIVTAFESGAATLKRKRRNKIGAPLLAAEVISIATKTGSADHVEIFAEVQLPKPLNRITLFLTA